MTVLLSRRQLIGCGAALAVLPWIGSAAFQPSTGITVLQQLKTGNRLLSPFTLQGNALYLNGDSTVEAWDKDKAQMLWQRPLESHAGFRPRLSEDVLITSGRHHLAAWDKDNGTARWRYAPNDELAVPLVHDNRIHFGDRHSVITLDATSGKRIWSFDTIASARIAYAPIGVGNKILIGPGDGCLYALSADKGELLWKVDREADWQYLRQLGIYNDLLIAGGYHDELFGINMQDGSIVWRFYAGNFINSQLVTDGKVCFWSPTGWIYALDANTGSVLWRHKTIDYKNRGRAQNWSPVMAELVARDNLLYILAMDHILHVLDLNTGDERASLELPERVRPFVSIDEHNPQRLFLGSNDGHILQLELT
jgi:outer membrane protein assembly factor BamB